MGVFQTLVPLRSRAPVELNIRFDGQDMKIPPLEAVMVPQVVVYFAKNQNPVMGKSDPSNPHISGGEYLVGVEGKDNCEPLTKEEWEDHLSRPLRVDEEALFEEFHGGDPTAKKYISKGGKRGRKPAARNRYEAGSSPGGDSAFGHDK